MLYGQIREEWGRYHLTIIVLFFLRKDKSELGSHSGGIGKRLNSVEPKATT